MRADGVVLVHGSNLSSTCWSPVLPHLRAPVTAVDLPGRCSRPADILTVTLDDCAGVVVESAAAAGFREFLLVGHSLGGVVITEVATLVPDRVSGLVYIGALVPAPGQSAAEVVFGADLPTTEARVATEERARHFFATDMTDAQWAGVWRQFGPESPLLWNARLRAYPQVATATYVSLEKDVGVPPVLAEQMIANVGIPVEHQSMSTGHMAMVTKPRELAGVINELVNC